MSSVMSSEFQISSILQLVLGAIISYVVIRDTLFVFGIVSKPSAFVGSILSLQRLRAGLPYLLHGPQVIIEEYEKVSPVNIAHKPNFG